MPARRPWLLPALLLGVLCASAALGLWCGTTALREEPDAAETGADAGVRPTPAGEPARPDAAPPDLRRTRKRPITHRETEAQLMGRVRVLVDPKPKRALALVRRAEARFPDGGMAAERSLLKMRALVHLNRIADARDEAVRFFRRHPRSPLGARVQRLTGVHPRPRPGP